MPLRGRADRDAEPDQLEFRFGSGALCLDFVASVGERWARSIERLRTPGDLGRWVVAAQLAPRRPPTDRRALAQARRLRSAIFDCVVAARDGARLPRSALQTVNRFAAGQDLAPQLGQSRSCRYTAKDTTAAALSTIARDAVRLLSSNDVGRIRECASSTCSRLFVDRSRPGRRRWCDSARCGNQAKTRAYRRRTHRVPAVGRRG